jgi:hypothetical protein
LSAAVEEYTDARAHALRERYHARFGGPELPVPVRSIAEDLLGLTIRESDDPEVSGMLVPATREIILSVREREFPGRRRFTLAHELGHWICHVAGAREAAPVYCRAHDVEPGADRALEREANIFAAELLMPEAAVRGGWRRSALRDELAATFGVSSEAMGWRLYSFGLAAERPRR